MSFQLFFGRMCVAVFSNFFGRKPAGFRRWHFEMISNLFKAIKENWSKKGKGKVEPLMLVHELVGNLKNKSCDWEGLERSQILGLFEALYTN